jgi:hypothetical protein
MLLLEQFCLMPFLFVRSKGLISMGFRAARAALRRNSGRTPYADPADAGFFFTAGRLAGEPGSFPGDRNSELSPHSSPTLGQIATRLEHLREADETPLIIRPYSEPEKTKRHWFWLKIALVALGTSVFGAMAVFVVLRQSVPRPDMG